MVALSFIIFGVFFSNYRWYGPPQCKRKRESIRAPYHILIGISSVKPQENVSLYEQQDLHS